MNLLTDRTIYSWIYFKLAKAVLFWIRSYSASGNQFKATEGRVIDPGSVPEMMNLRSIPDSRNHRPKISKLSLPELHSKFKLSALLSGPRHHSKSNQRIHPVVPFASRLHADSD